MTTVVVVGIVALAMINFASRASGPAVLADREPSERTQDVVTRLSPALLAGLVVVEMAGPHWSELDWTRIVVLVVAAVAYRRGQPDLVCILLAVVATAGLGVGPSAVHPHQREHDASYLLGAGGRSGVDARGIWICCGDGPDGRVRPQRRRRSSPGSPSMRCSAGRR